MPMPAEASWRLFWAKTNRGAADGLPTRPLWAHLLDVAHTALLLWENVLPMHLKHRMARDLGLSIEDAGYVLSFWIGLHDIGKAIPTFQALHEPSRKRLDEAGFRFRGYTERRHHGHAGISILAVWLRARGAASLFADLSAWVGAHHGRLYPRDSWDKDASNVAMLGDDAWREARHRLLQEVEAVWFERYPVASKPEPDPGALPLWLPVFGGWTTLADWLGSMAPCFPHEVGDDLAAYLGVSREGAARALKAAGLDQTAGLTDPGFQALFPFPPNPMQQALVDLPLPEADAPTLVVVEGPTGEGKTEAAFARAARQQAHTGGSGLYVAMPTQATSNGLFPRTLDFLRRAHPGAANVRLVHGNADLLPEQEKLVCDVADLETLFDADDAPAGPDAVTGAVRTLRWFLPRKRSLLAPYGLGTVDQAFLGVLYARHFFLRLFALAGKTVIFDEVHAYDLYMQRLFSRLLRWLHAVGAHVILLSATLPAQLRSVCFRAWGSAVYEGKEAPVEIPYPAVWLVHNGRATLAAGSFATRWSQQATLARHDPDPESVAAAATRAYREGAAVLVVCNTVRRAQAIFKALPDDVRAAVDDVMLLHARYRFGVRGQREKDVLDRFGEKRPNGRGAILVATQLAEQSLNLDADVLFTDLAPIDLLLQRAGRLHRYLELRPPAARPAGYQVPKVCWLCPEADPGHLPDLTVIGVNLSRYTVYTPDLVWKTWDVLKDRSAWSLPADYRALIEEVYSEGAAPEGLTPEARATWDRAAQCFEKLDAEAKQMAGQQLIPEPTSSDIKKFFEADRRLMADEDDGHAHPSQRALTRLGTETAEVVLLFEDAEGRLCLDPEGTQPAPLTAPPGRTDLPPDAARALLRNAVRISYEDLARALAARPEADLPPEWSAAPAHTPALQQHIPLVLKDRTAVVAGFRITDNEVLGVCIERVKKEGQVPSGPLPLAPA